MKVIFLENYNVSLAEALMPATDISEQISLAGKEASGTGNMKMMINGAVTIGTMDGANVEMFDAVGDDSIFIFGQTAEEVLENLRNGYDAKKYYEENDQLKAAVDSLKTGFNGKSFAGIQDYLLKPSYSIADPYMCLKDFGSYCDVHENIQEAYEDRPRWNRMSATNIAMLRVPEIPPEEQYFHRNNRAFLHSFYHFPALQELYNSAHRKTFRNCFSLKTALPSRRSSS